MIQHRSMHKLVVLTVIVVFSSLQIQAQNESDDYSKFRWGILASPVISWLNVTNNDLQADGATLNFNFGAIAEYSFNRFFSFITGLSYNRLSGYVFDNSSLNNSTIKGNYQLNYSEIGIPAEIKIRTPYFKNVAYFIQGGISTGFVLNANETFFPVLTGTKPYNTDISQFTNPATIGYIAGGGIQYRIGRKSYLFGQINFNKTITNIANSELYTSGTSPKYNSSVIIFPENMEFSFGIMF